jgi:excisionase family DNA binding protein
MNRSISHEFLTKKEAADEARVSEKTIDRAIRRRVLRRVNNGVRKVVIARAELLRWMNGGLPRGI